MIITTGWIEYSQAPGNYDCVAARGGDYDDPAYFDERIENSIDDEEEDRVRILEMRIDEETLRQLLGSQRPTTVSVTVELTAW